MKNLSKILCVLCVLCGVIAANGQTKLTSRVLLIPLDDRPPCLQFPVKMGLIGDVEVVTPPRNLLGRFTEFGKPDQIIKWLKTQNLKSFDAAIISLDMLAYGGLVAMREYETDTATAMKRAEFIREIRKLSPKLKIYGSSVIMRLAPTGNVVNESYRVNLARWAEISVDPAKKAETTELEKKIPAEALEKYKRARARDLKLNLYAVELTRDKVFDYLILSQDDAKPNGVHVADRETLIDYVKSNNLGERVAVQPGADEVSMLLLARSMTDKYKYRPKIKAIYSDEKIADQFMPYEDRPLRKTVSFHIKAVGAQEVANESQADILFYVFVSRFEKGKAESFADEIFKSAKEWKKYIIADIDIKGDVQGADVVFTQELLGKEIFFNYTPAGYASWNTAGNTIGTALPQGVIFSTAFKDLLDNSISRGKSYREARNKKNAIPKFGNMIEQSDRVAKAQIWFNMNRLLDDFIYHSIVRPEALKFIRENKMSSLRLKSDEKEKVEKLIRQRMAFYMSKYAPTRLGRAVPCCFDGDNLSVTCLELEKFNIFLPWERTFEAEIDFNFRRCLSIT